MDIKKARNYFPLTKKGIIYFNHAATAPLSTKVVEVLNKYINKKTDGDIENYNELQSTVAETKRNIGGLINCNPDRIAYLDNTSNGINILAQGIEWKHGDRILLNDIEFPANVYPFLNLERKGVKIDFVKSKDWKVSAEDILENIRPGTRMVSISQVQFLSGYRVSLNKIGEYCLKNNIIFCVDAIQGLGAVRMDVSKDNIDFISCGTQKWMLGQQGFGFVYVSEKLQEKIHQSYLGWLSVKGAWDFLNYEINLKDSADRFQGGTLNTIGIISLGAALNVFLEFGWDEIENAITQNTEYFIEKFNEAGIKTIQANFDRSNLAGITSVKLEKAQEIFDELSKKNIYFSLRAGILRFSPHFYNTKAEIEFVVDEIKKVID